jgi:precorrin-4/cobalt-precorrin-4 C11-methyltransferase
MAGRTPVPERESIASLAAHGATMVIFLSAGMIEKVVSELKKGGYADDTPVSVIERASWPGQKLIEGTVADIAGKAKEAGIKKTALIYVGRAMRPDIGTRRLSRLYDKDFEHGYRKKK